MVEVEHEALQNIASQTPHYMGLWPVHRAYDVAVECLSSLLPWVSLRHDLLASKLCANFGIPKIQDRSHVASQRPVCKVGPAPSQTLNSSTQAYTPRLRSLNPTMLDSF